ncbi:MAG: universal stress protein [Pyrinomonadaceae bacterium]
MKILIATDGSEFSLLAVEKACEFIERYRDAAEVRLVSIYEAPTVATEPFMTLPDHYEGIRKSVEKLSDGYVESARAAINERLPRIAVVKEVAMGVPGRTIVEIAEEWGADLIVVGSHGRGFWSRALMGSVSDAVVNHAPCSVLVVRGPAGSSA